MRLPPGHTLFPYTTLFRSREDIGGSEEEELRRVVRVDLAEQGGVVPEPGAGRGEHRPRLHRGVEEVRREVVAVIEDRKSTRLNSSHVAISYAVFCLKKKNN